MSFHEREGLLARVRHIRRLQARSDDAAAATPELPPLESLETRVAHLEQMMQGLQDSVHIESTRQNKRITDLEAQVQPAAMSQALDKDARERGL